MVVLEPFLVVAGLTSELAVESVSSLSSGHPVVFGGLDHFT